jgi:DNA polymerase-3 subunit beta
MSNDLMDVMMGSENELIGKKEQERNVVTVRVRDRDTFFSMISDVSKVCATSDAIPVLQMIKMSIKKSVPRRKKDGSGMEEAQGNAVTLIGSDGIITMIKAVATLDGAENAVIEADRAIDILIPKTFGHICDKPPAGECILELEEEKLTIRIGKARYTLATLDVSEYPEIKPEDGVSFSTRTQTLAAAIRATLYAAEKNDTQPTLNAVHIKGSTDGLLLQASNRRIGSLEMIPIEMPQDVEFNSILSARTAKLIMDLFSKTDVQLKVSVGDSLIRLAGPGFMLMSKLIAGEPINLDKKLPKTFASECVLKRDETLGSFQRALAITDKNDASIIFRLEKGEFSISARGEIGNGGESLSTAEVTGDMRGCIDANIVIETLKSLQECEHIRLQWNDPLQALIVVPVLKEGEPTRKAIMVPLRSREV